MSTDKQEAAASVSLAKKRRNDIIFIASIAAIVLTATLCILLFRSRGSTVTVTVDGRLYGEYSLSENRRVEISGDGWHNLLIIENGTARVEHASCPDGICSEHRPIRYGGESIICLPNQVVIEVHTDTPDGPDVVA